MERVVNDWLFRESPYRIIDPSTVVADRMTVIHVYLCWACMFCPPLYSVTTGKNVEQLQIRM